LLNCMAGLDTWDKGHITQVTAAGASIDIGPMTDTQRALWRRAQVGFVFQAFHVLPHLDVQQNIALPLMLLDQPDAARVSYLLDAVGLVGLGARLPQQLSGGQLQRVAIARALVHKPPLVLADEPTGNLDPTTAARIMQLLRQQTREHGASLVMVTHSGAAAAQADRVVRLTTQGVADSVDAHPPTYPPTHHSDEAGGISSHL
jgi:putative ABC transport system ATP-binding protein